MKVKISVSKLMMGIALLCLFVIFLVHTINGNKLKSQKPDLLRTLFYTIYEPRAPISLNLFEAEFYEPAVVVQQLIGNLVYYSNNGRYEPRISESWERVSSIEWSFKLKKGYTCENGEEINPASFKESLIRSLKIALKQGEVPVFGKLKGFSEFASGKNNSISGIKVDGDFLIFQFSEPIRSGLLQQLSFAPFGYICTENLNSDLTWKDSKKFISSGPYKVESIDIGKEYVLSKRKEWPEFASRSPDKVVITHQIPAEEKNRKNLIVDARRAVENIPSDLKNYPLVPEYLNAIFLGNLKHGFFGSIDNRRALDSAIQEVRKGFPQKWSNHIQSAFFYPSQQLTKKPIPNFKAQAPKSPLIIEGKQPIENTPRYFAWQILMKALDTLGWNYKINNNPPKWEEMSNPNYDIRIMNPSVGGGVEAWGLDVIFFSISGAYLPDPSGRVKQMLLKYEKDQLTDQELTEEFLSTIEEDSAILPISHFGLQWYISSQISTRSISPLISVIRFDQTELE